MVADLQIARGLDYYTGMVFEGRMEMLGTLSICAGGRYDALATDGRSTYPGVGISLGVTRLVAPLVARGLLDADRSVPSAVLVALPDDDARERCRLIARALRTRGIATEVAPDGRQVRQADPARRPPRASRTCGSRPTPVPATPTRSATSGPVSSSPLTQPPGHLPPSTSRRASSTPHLHPSQGDTP